MATQLTREVYGEVIPVRRMNEMARRISTNINGNKSLAFAGFVWYRPQAVAEDRLPETQARAA